MKKLTFALFFANRGFFPGELISGAVCDMKKAVTDCGYDYICMEETKTKYGAVETIDEGKAYAEFLKENEGKYQGVIVSLPNFGDENGAVVALKNANVPILVQAYPDEIGKMDFEHRRDAMCGKIAMCNVLRQCNIPVTLTKEFVIHPSSKSFQNDVEIFAGICRVVNGMKNFNIGAIGARTTAFKTVRVDEIALQNKNINIETIDLSDVFMRMEKVTDEKMENKMKDYLNITVFEGYPNEKLQNISRLGVVVDDIIKEYDLHAIALRCWSEFQIKLGIAPCLILCDLNERGIAAACELDISNAIMMRAISLASDSPCMLLDLNNNYDSCDDKCIMFHCGPVPISMLKGKGQIIEHKMFAKSFGEGSGVGVNRGDIMPADVTFGSFKTENGALCSFVGHATLTDDSIEKGFFGSGVVMQKDNINAVTNYIAENGYRHHLCISHGSYQKSIYEAFTKYLGYKAEIL